MRYREWIERASRRKRSPIVLALDLPAEERLLERSLRIVEEVSPFVCAVKLGQTALRLGLFEGTRALVQRCHGLDLPVIMDCKLNDVGHVNRALAETFFEVGFDAVTANPFVGWEEGLEPVFDLARREGKGVILLVYMSHRGAVEGYGQEVVDPRTGSRRFQYEVLAERCLAWGADGAVVGATFPDKIRRVHRILGGRVPIYSPGVIAQGGKVEEALRAGARYLIVGRAITSSEEPAEAARAVRDLASASLQQGSGV